MKNFRLLALLGLLPFIGACVATGPEFTGLVNDLSDNMATVYVYRPNRFMMGGAAPEVYVNDELGFRLKNNGYNFFHLAPGTHVIDLRETPTWGSYPSPKLIPIELAVEGGRMYFLKLNLDEAGFDSTNINAFAYTGQVGLMVVDEGTARSEMIGTKLSE